MYVQYWPQQQGEDNGRKWIDLFLTAGDQSLVLGTFIVFYDDESIEAQRDVYFHRFDGLPKKILSFESE